jgi:hypothetical protein
MSIEPREKLEKSSNLYCEETETAMSDWTEGIYPSIPIPYNKAFHHRWIHPHIWNSHAKTITEQETYLCLTPSDIQGEGHYEVVCYLILCAISILISHCEMQSSYYENKGTSGQNVISAHLDLVT